MTISNAIINQAIFAHRDAVSALSALSSLIPSNDDMHPLVAVLTSNLEASHNALVAVLYTMQAEINGEGDNTA